MFQSGKELDGIFSAEASFYKLRTGERTQICRSRAIIRRTGCGWEGNDALFVLLNPGKSLPVAGEDSIELLSGEVEQLPLLPAVPDKTMYQTMRLMQRMNWNSVEIINLTDLRTGKFEEYLESQQFMRVHRDLRHSIFFIDRYIELLNCLEGADTVIAGWGTKSLITPAAEEAYTILTELEDVGGLAYKKHPLFYHPFPWIQSKCIKWLDDMEVQLKPVEELV